MKLHIPLFNIIFYLNIVLLLTHCSGRKSSTGQAPEKDAPNVILIITDDQGYGDLGAHGNPSIQTPAMDRLYRESTRFTNFHVGTTCAPTRAGLMTGRHNNRVGVWHTVMGRSLLPGKEVTMAEVFQQSGYKTGMFGKWHLGDNYPFRPQDQGFEEVLIHGGGGVGQTPDYWNNDYFGDTYWRNGQPEKFEDYCTNVWFGQAIDFITNNKDNRFFCYISTNAPHSPFRVPAKYRQMYEGKENVFNANFYGMITNIDDNLGMLRNHLDSLGIAENTILVFTTDNGTSAGVQLGHQGFPEGGFNAQMRGKKGSQYEGGHRVPLFIKWDEGGIPNGKDVNQLTSFMDVLPTLMDLCNLEYPEKLNLDGKSLTPLIRKDNPDWSDRVIITDNQRLDRPEKWRMSATMQGPWRLINGEELYNLENDPGQRENIAGEYPEKVESLRAAYNEWWSSVKNDFPDNVRIPIGNENANPIRLTGHDWHPKPKNELPPWHQSHIREGLVSNGTWTLDVQRSGKYKIGLRRWPESTGLGIKDAVPKGDDIPGDEPYQKGNALAIQKAELNIGENSRSKTIDGNPALINFEVGLEKGSANLSTRFIDAEDKVRGAYYVEIEYLGEQ